MSKQEFIDNINESILKFMEETNKGVIKDYTINSVVNWKTGEEVGQAALLTCGSKYEFTEDVLKHWKEILCADEYRIMVNHSRLLITFMINYIYEDNL